MRAGKRHESSIRGRAGLWGKGRARGPIYCSLPGVSSHPCCTLQCVPKIHSHAVARMSCLPGAPACRGLTVEKSVGPEVGRLLVLAGVLLPAPRGRPLAWRRCCSDESSANVRCRARNGAWPLDSRRRHLLLFLRTPFLNRPHVGTDRVSTTHVMRDVALTQTRNLPLQAPRMSCGRTRHDFQEKRTFASGHQCGNAARLDPTRRM
jgi:hypothetical protein